MELLKTYADRLGDYQNLSQLIRSELQMFEKINPNVGVNGEMNQVPDTGSLTDILNGLIIDGGRAPTA